METRVKYHNVTWKSLEEAQVIIANAKHKHIFFAPSMGEVLDVLSDSFSEDVQGSLLSNGNKSYLKLYGSNALF